MLQDTAQKELFVALKRHLNKKSKWYEIDLADLKTACEQKTDEEAMESLSRDQATENIPQWFMDQNCQFGGLPKIGIK
tara:strand:- start:490 stop:723 length:234 start_codon:yes stop_codon:yes gene_type:complete